MANTPLERIKFPGFPDTFTVPDVSQIKATLLKKVNQPLDTNGQPVYGTSGQVLRTKGDGSTEWTTFGLPTDEQTAQAVADWFEANPQSTTTVVDGSITEVKLADALKAKTIKDYVTPEMYGAVGDGVADDTSAIQNAIDANPNCTILFSKIYGITSPIVTSATEAEKVYLKFLSGSVIKALASFEGNYAIDIGGKGTLGTLHNVKYITGIDGCTIDTASLCGGLLVEQVQMPRITNITVLNLGAFTGVQLDKPNSADNINSMDAYIDNVIVSGINSNEPTCTGFVINAHDNDIRNIRPIYVNIGMIINGSHNRISNAHPVRGSSDVSGQFAIYKTSKAFVLNNNNIYLTNCYSDNFAVGIDVKAGSIFFAVDFTLLWWENYDTVHTFIKIENYDGIDQSTKHFWGHISGGDLMFKAIGTNKGIDGTFTSATDRLNPDCIQNLYIANTTTLAETDPILSMALNANKVWDYNNKEITVADLNAIAPGTTGRARFASSISPTGQPNIFLFNCIGDTARKQLMLVSPATGDIYVNAYSGSWTGWKRLSFTTDASANIVEDLSDFSTGDSGRTSFAASISPTGTQQSLIYECLGGDETRKVLIAYNYANQREYVNAYDGTAWSGWKSRDTNDGVTTTPISDLSTIKFGHSGRASFAAAVSPTGSQQSFIYECLGGDDSRKVLVAYNYSNKKKYINSWTGSAWTGWTEA